MPLQHFFSNLFSSVVFPVFCSCLSKLVYFTPNISRNFFLHVFLQLASSNLFLSCFSLF
ncbi:unnamed protein product [Meloidogyne enterolobii]|uniref:Uncharacterized protein n=1 Tax=Meloidogyne enterolobii TaxID=390850 RepID=A0ACB0ZZF1_MELEN